MAIKMQWQPMGKLFTPQNHALPLGCSDYAQSPQAVILDDRFRVYCTSRARDDSGKFLSQVIYVDFDFGWHFMGHSNAEVIPLGKLGTFDEHGIFPFSPCHINGRIIAYTCGWSRRVSVDVETATGFAETFDSGKTFKKLGNGPVFASSIHEPMLVGDSFVRKYGDIYQMWYIYGTKWVKEHDDSKPDRIYKIGHAVSDDGLNWQQDYRQIIPDILHDNECQALPSVLYHNGIYHMAFCYRDVFGFRIDPSKGYRIGYAYSLDGQYWVRDDDLGGLKNAQSTWDRDMMSYPHLMTFDDHVYCLYNGNQFGREGFGGYVLDKNCMQWKHNQAVKNQILTHFQNCDQAFVDELSSRVNMNEYVDKLINKAERIELWDQDKLIGMLAVYWNKTQDYISNISVDSNYTKRGIGTELVERCVSISSAQGKSSIAIEVQVDNKSAIKLYQKSGFDCGNENNSYIGMKVTLKNE
jgi:ribosomal protein S18 acetylase RimI-like enzyme